jgi:hypothetical protein
MTNAGVISSGPDDSPTGFELVDLVAAAVRRIRNDEVLHDQSLKEGLVKTIYAHEGLGSQIFFDWLQFAKDTYKLGLFGIGELSPLAKPAGFVEDDA